MPMSRRAESDDLLSGPSAEADRTITHQGPKDPSASNMFQRVAVLARVAILDVREADLTVKALVAGLVLVTAYEYGPGNELITPLITGPLVRSSRDELGVIAATAVAFGSVAMQQILGAWLSRRVLLASPRTTSTIYDQLHHQPDDAFLNFGQLSFWRRMSNSLFLGSTYNVIRESFLSDSADQRTLRDVGRASAFLAASIVGIIAALAAGLAAAFPTNIVVAAVITVVAHPLPWFGLAILALCLDIKRSRVSHSALRPRSR